ncbi:hypothetical protein [Pseudomonas sp. NPDC089534]|uniref:hypothetical protein n=1 Tax=Pseudomonas sp. NPDC089534 TaxID=3364468 RepID=UPI003802663F
MKDAERESVKVALEGIFEQLAVIEHDRWSHWQRYMHSKGVRQTDGSLLIPPDLVEWWERQMTTDYADLTEKEKDGDREQVQKYLPLILKTLTDI